MTPGNDQRAYWDRNLDIQNLGSRTSSARLDLNRELAFYFSPEQEYALTRLWGDEGPKGKRILEIGCGLGLFALFLAIQEAEVHVVDISSSRLDFLRKKAFELGLDERIHVHCAPAENLPFADEFFDAVYTKSVLIHTDLPHAAAEAARVLKPGGRGVFVEPLDANPLVNLYRRWFAPKEWKTIAVYFNPERLRMLARPFGSMTVGHFYLIGFLAFFWQFGLKNLTLFRSTLAILHPLDRFLFRLLPPLKRLAWFAVACAVKK